MLTWNDFSYDEKRAILKSAIQVGLSHGNINYSQNQYLGVLLIRMDVDQKIINDANTMWNLTMRHVLKSMNSEKKDVLVSIWYDIACRSMGGVYSSAAETFRSFPEVLPTVKHLANECDINIDRYL